jgi:hypothetical protein
MMHDDIITESSEINKLEFLSYGLHILIKI